MIDTQDPPLVAGECYFQLTYYDANLRFPEIKTLVYLGKDLFSEDKGASPASFYFQDPETFLSRTSASSATDESKGLLVVREDGLSAICTWDELLKELADNRHAQECGHPFT